MESSALIYISLTVVTILFALCIQTREAWRGTRAYARNNVAEAAIFCLLAGVSACRVAIGHDYWNYWLNFQLIAQDRHVSSESGFNLFVKAMQFVFGEGNYKAIFGLFSLVTVFFFLRAIHDQAADYAFSLFLLLTNGYYFQSMNSIRYYLALAVALYAMKHVLRGEYGKFILWILVGMTFHKSILLVVPVYLAARLLAGSRLKKWHYIAGALLMSTLVFGQNFYREIAFYFYPYYRDSAFDHGVLSYTNIAKCLGTLILCGICYGRGIRENVANRFYFFLNVAGLAAYCCGSFIPEVSRIGYYMSISQIFLVPALLREMPSGWFQRLCRAGVAGAFTLHFVMLLQKMYTDDVALLPYLSWIFN